MLKFPCICGNNFALEDDQAGSEFQCPRCGRLVIAPSLTDLESLSADGTYKVETPPAADDPSRVAELHRTFMKSRTDASGGEIDLRTTQEEWQKVGDDPAGNANPPRV